MKAFKDSAGRDWTIAINVAVLKSVRSQLSVDLTDMASGDPPLLQRLTFDYELVCNVLFVLCETQAKSLGVSDEDFGRSMGGDALRLGMTAMMEELADFFQKLGRREVALMIEKQAALIEAAVSHAADKLEAIDTDRLAQSLASPEQSGNSFTDSPESSESTPVPLRSAS